MDGEGQVARQVDMRRRVGRETAKRTAPGGQRVIEEKDRQTEAQTCKGAE